MDGLEANLSVKSPCFLYILLLNHGKKCTSLTSIKQKQIYLPNNVKCKNDLKHPLLYCCNMLILFYDKVKFYFPLPNVFFVVGL